MYIFVFLYKGGAHIQGTPFWRTMRQSFWDVFYATVCLTVFMYLGHISHSVSRFFILSVGLFSFLFITVGRYICKKMMTYSCYFQMPVIFVGAGEMAEKLADIFSNDVGFGYYVVGFIDANPSSKKIVSQYRILGNFDNAERIIRMLGVQHVIVAMSDINQDEQVSIVDRIQPYVKSVSFIPSLTNIPGQLNITSLSDSGYVSIKVQNNLMHLKNIVVKRIFDILFSLLGMIIVIPICVALAIYIYIDDPGPIFYSKPRIGKGNKEFICYKFRSMYVNGDEILKKYLEENPAARAEWDEFAKLKDDPRVTPAGKFMRKTSLDELPQIFNVILGNMSLVGPRPYLPREREAMGDYLSIISMTQPGITGLWQISGRSEISFARRLQMDSWYVHNWSVWMDFAYLLKTVVVVLKRKGAY